MSVINMHRPRNIFDYGIYTHCVNLEYIAEAHNEYVAEEKAVQEYLRGEILSHYNAIGHYFAKLVDDGVISFSAASYLFRTIIGRILNICPSIDFMDMEFAPHYVRYVEERAKQTETEEIQHAIRAEAAESM